MLKPPKSRSKNLYNLWPHFKCSNSDTEKWIDFVSINILRDSLQTYIERSSKALVESAYHLFNSINFILDSSSYKTLFANFSDPYAGITWKLGIPISNTSKEFRNFLRFQFFLSESKYRTHTFCQSRAEVGISKSEKRQKPVRALSEYFIWSMVILHTRFQGLNRLRTDTVIVTL